jgi:DNA-directed RNA polymerase subunit alpha
VLIAQRPILTEEVVSDYRSRFIIEPLEPGFGYTLGNSIRRTLLSSSPGAAVTGIRVNGALHEFTTLEGVKEDLTEIVLNIKNLVLSSDNDEPTSSKQIGLTPIKVNPSTSYCLGLKGVLKNLKSFIILSKI